MDLPQMIKYIIRIAAPLQWGYEQLNIAPVFYSPIKKTSGFNHAAKIKDCTQKVIGWV
jgi:hypothetical protein